MRDAMREQYVAAGPMGPWEGTYDVVLPRPLGITIEMVNDLIGITEVRTRGDGQSRPNHSLRCRVSTRLPWQSCQSQIHTVYVNKLIQ